MPTGELARKASGKPAGAPEAGEARAINIAQPLQGLRVLDLGWVAMGPYAGYLLSCLGADVIHIARPPSGDPAGVDHAAYNYGFDTLNTGKTWVAIDLQRRAGVALLKQLAARSDIVLENFRPGVSTRLGIGYDALSAANPRLVMLSASTYGERQMGAPYPGYAPVFAALAGLADLTGNADGAPTEVSTPVDFFAGAVGVLGLLAGLHRLRATGRGCHIDFSAREAILWSLAHAWGSLQAGQADLRRIGNSHPDMAPHGVYPCAGENHWLSIAVGSDAEWQCLCTCAGAALADACFATVAGRIEQRSALDTALAQWTRTQQLWALCERLQAAGVAAYPSASSEDLWNNRHLKTRGMFQPGSHGSVSTWHAAAPWAYPGQMRSPLPTTDGAAAIARVFGGILGLLPERIAELMRSGVIAQRARSGA